MYDRMLQGRRRPENVAKDWERFTPWSLKVGRGDAETRWLESWSDIVDLKATPRSVTFQTSYHARALMSCTDPRRAVGTPIDIYATPRIAPVGDDIDAMIREVIE